MKKRRFFPILLIGLLFSLPAATFARSENSDVKRLPGFVDGSAFGELAGEEGEIVEVNLGPSLLGAISRGADNDPEAKSLLGGLRSVTAYIVKLEKDTDRTARASKLVREMEAHLDSRGWERVARIREKNERVNVFTLTPDGIVVGLVVLVFSADEGEVVFANLAGSIDLAKIGDIGNTLHVPGLDKMKKDQAGKPSPKPATGDKEKNKEEDQEEEEQP